MRTCPAPSEAALGVSKRGAESDARCTASPATFPNWKSEGHQQARAEPCALHRVVPGFLLADNLFVGETSSPVSTESSALRNRTLRRQARPRIVCEIKLGIVVKIGMQPVAAHAARARCVT